MLSLPDFREKNIVICFAAEGQKVSFKNDNLIVKDGEENTVLQTTCHKIFSLWIVGSITITSGILERSKKFGFSIYMLLHNCKPYGLWNSTTEGNFLLRKKQYDYNDLSIARHLVNNKIINQIELLKSQNMHSKPQPPLLCKCCWVWKALHHACILAIGLTRWNGMGADREQR